MKMRDPKLNTFTILCMRYMSPVVHLDTIVEDCFNHMDVKTTRKKTNYMQALLKLAAKDYTRSQLLKDLDIALDYYK